MFADCGNSTETENIKKLAITEMKQETREILDAHQAAFILGQDNSVLNRKDANYISWDIN